LAILESVELRIGFGGDYGARHAAAGTELRGSGERGAVGGGLQESALITEITHVDREAGCAEENDEADGGEDEAVAGLARSIFCGGEFSHCDISRKNLQKKCRPGDEGRRRCGE
jgi:hypothetical protein